MEEVVVARRAVSNPLALAVLATLWERPMHPYEIASTMRERHKEHSIKLHYGSLYTVVDGLAKAGLIRPIETAREGNRPERTVYELTPAGKARTVGWLSELLRAPAKEYPQFMAGLALMGVLPPEDAAALLEERIERLEAELAGTTAELADLAEQGLPRVVLVEVEYEQALRRAEADFVRGLLADLLDGSLDGLPMWRALHAADSPAGAGGGGG
jgi:DNA-binding PadR family transcriptional regulator